MPKRMARVDVKALLGFTALMERHPDHAPTMVVARVANNILVAQYRGREAEKLGEKPRKKLEFWIYGVLSSGRVNRSLVYRIQQPLDTMAKGFGQKIHWSKGGLEIVKYGGLNYAVKRGVISDIYAFVPEEGSMRMTVRGHYYHAFKKLKKAGISLKTAREKRG